jgi:hypothetical protein
MKQMEQRDGIGSTRDRGQNFIAGLKQAMPADNGEDATN